jgi:small subunit ribosomal protein S17
MADETKKPNKQEKVGEVISDKMNKTIVVQVSRRVAHPLYKRIVTKHKKFYAHDEEGKAKVGDVVRIIECRPMSRLKRWLLQEVVRKAVVVTIDLPAEVAVQQVVASGTGGRKKANPAKNAKKK